MTLDADLKKKSWWHSPKAVNLYTYPPYIRIRHHKNDAGKSVRGRQHDNRIVQRLEAKIKQAIYNLGFNKYFLPYRPYEFYEAGCFKEELVSVAKGVGLTYMFSKSGFGGEPKIHYVDEDFIALNYTAGQWDGWTPFVTINNIHDLKRSEKKMINRKKPGWIISTIDSCLWTFSGHVWEKGEQLYEIASYCAKGGDSRQLVNVHPYTIARYARIMAQKGL